jgi:hypothetical protein
MERRTSFGGYLTMSVDQPREAVVQQVRSATASARRGLRARLTAPKVNAFETPRVFAVREGHSRGYILRTLKSC